MKCWKIKRENSFPNQHNDAIWLFFNTSSAFLIAMGEKLIDFHQHHVHVPVWTRAQFDGALLRSIRERSNLQRRKNERKVSTTNRMEEFLVVNSNSFKKIAFDFTLIASEWVSKWVSKWVRETRTTNKTFPFWFINSHQFVLRCQHMHGTSRRSFTATASLMP